MPDPSLITLFVVPLNSLRIHYMITGGVASVIYGEPRFTRDIDLVVKLEPRDARRFAGAWSPTDFYVPPIEVLEEESHRAAHGHFNVSHHDTTMRADVYLAGDDALNAWALDRRVIRQVDDQAVKVAPIEAVILGKLRYYRLGKSDRHLRDIHQMLRISGDLVDRAALDRWIATLGVGQEWQLAKDYQDA